MGWMSKAGVAGLVTWGSMVGMAGAAASQGLADQVFQVPAMEQAAGQPLEFVRTKRMEAGLAVKPVAIDLGEWAGLKSAPDMQVYIIGASRAVEQAKSVPQTAQLLQWQPSANGGMVAALSLRSSGAQGLRLGLVVDQLPGSAMLRLYTDHQPAAVFEIAGQRVMQILQANRDAGDNSEAGRTWWTPSSSGEQVTLEIELPPGTAPEQLKVSMPEVMHIYENLSLPLGGLDADDEQAKTIPVGSPVECHLDVNCSTQAATERKGVARMAYVTERLADGRYYYGLCTGSLLNDAQSSGTPYFLTAAHCISTQTIASALETDWFYTSTRCSSNSLSPSSVNLRNGSQLLYANANPDVTLLKLNDTPPAGAMFLGWNSGVVPDNTPVVGVHHPSGGLQKISMGVMSSRADCSIDGKDVSCFSAPNSGVYYYVRWSMGLTQQGSSGSPLFNNGAVTGVLTAASEASCRANGAGAYSFYPSLNSVMPALRKWLVDAGAGATTPPASGRTPVYRFYNTQNGTHFFTANAQERDALVQGNTTYQYENIGFYASTQTAAAPQAVYRFFNNNSGSHFYTINADERAFVIANYPQFSVEGVAWYARQAAGEGSVPMYRFNNTLTGAHFYTTNAAERDFVVATYPQFVFEGIAYYVWGSQ